MKHRNQLTEELSVQLLAAFRTFRGDIGKIFEPYIPWNEFVVLRILHRETKEMVSRVASELNVSNSHITAVSEKLLTKQLVRRFRSELDRRVVYLEITEQGRQLVSEMDEKREAYFAQKFSALSEDDMEEMIRIFRTLL